MKDLAASAAADSPASIEAAYALVCDLERYPAWYPSGVRAAEVLERDLTGQPTKVKTTLHVAVGPLVRDFKLHCAVLARPLERVELRRIPKDTRDREEMTVVWRLAPGRGGAGTEIAVDLKARLSIPPLLPVGGVADGIARGFLNAALNRLKD